MKILDGDGFAVYIYDNEHPPPHCHIIYANKRKVVAGLPLLNGMYGTTVDRLLKKYLTENLELLTETWESKHPNKWNKANE
jgi:hypothetical protein